MTAVLAEAFAEPYKLARGDLMHIELPFGSFTLQESRKPILFVAGSTGFAPIKSIIEEMHAIV